MKKTISYLLMITLLVGCFIMGSCNTEAIADGELQIVTTIFPIYDWVVNVLGENPAKADVTMLLDSGVDLHSFQPTADDILNISKCDIFLYVGGESDEWVEDALREATNEDMVVLNLLEVLGDAAREEEIVEGMQDSDHDHEHEEEHEHEEHEHEHEEAEYDEHIWLSLRNAELLVREIGAALKKTDPGNAELYDRNADAYIEKLAVLDEAYQNVVSDASVKTLLFGDRFPFRYMTEDYFLTYYAAFSGCSAETEASFETIVFLANKLDELSLPAVMTIEGANHRIAKTIIQTSQNRNQKILTLDSMQMTTKKDVSEGTTYLSVMEKNLEVLKEALK